MKKESYRYDLYVSQRAPWLPQVFPLERQADCFTVCRQKSKKSKIWSPTDTNVWVNYAHRIVFGRCRGRRGCNSCFLWDAVIRKYIMLQCSLALHNSYRSVSTENGIFFYFFITENGNYFLAHCNERKALSHCHEMLIFYIYQHYILLRKLYYIFSYCRKQEIEILSGCTVHTHYRNIGGRELM